MHQVNPLQRAINGLMLQWSQALAGRVLNDSGLSPEQQVERAFRIVFARAPKDDERQAVLDFLKQQSAEIAGRLAKTDLAKTDKVSMPDHVPQGMDAARAAAFVDFCQALLNSNEFLYLN